MDATNKFIGSGLIFPIQLDSLGRATVDNGYELLRTSIVHIMAYPKDTRWFNEKFGARLWEVLEEPNDLIGVSLVKTFVLESIRIWEPRVELLEVTVLTGTATLEKIDIQLTYRIRNSKTKDTFIFAFYKELIY